MKPLKRQLLTMAFVSAGLTGMAQTANVNRGFVHPGGLHSQQDFERVKQQIADNDPIVKKAYDALLSWGQTNTDTGAGATEEIIRGKTNNTANAAKRVKNAYKYALLWNLTGDAKYGDLAISILNTWAQVCKRVTGDTNSALASGLQGYQFAQVGELMRGYEGWKPEDFKAYQKWMLDVFYTGNTYFLYVRNGMNPGGYWSNWGLANALSLMSIGILCDDVYIYNMGSSFIKYDMVPVNNQCKNYRHDVWWDYTKEPYINYPAVQETADGQLRDNGYNEYIGNLVMALHEDERGVDINGDGKLWLGQMQELGRDQGHNVMSVGEIADICQTAWSQGDDIWSWMGNRVAAGIECTALYNYDQTCTVPYKKYHYRYDNSSNNYNDFTISGASSASRGHNRPIWDRVVSHFEGIKGIKMNYTRKMAETNTSALDEFSGVDHFGLNHLMSIIPARTDGKRMVYLEPYVEVDGKREHMSCYDNLAVGASITLSVEIPDSVAGGEWSWDMGADSVSESSKTNQLVVSPAKSNIYRAIYKAPNGTTSTQMFSVGVHGDCYADPVKKYFWVSNPNHTDINGWKGGNMILIYPGSNSTLSCQAGTNTGSWRYWTKEKDGTLNMLAGNIFNMVRDTTVYIEYTNMGGGVTLDSVKFIVDKSADVAKSGVDVTSQYIPNPTFDLGVIFAKDAAAKNVVTNAVDQQRVWSIEGWKCTSPITDQTDGFKTNEMNIIGASAAYGTKVKFNGVSVPSRPANSTSDAALFINSSWGTSVVYQTEDVTLPAGSYLISYVAYNAGSTNKTCTNLTGFVDASGFTYYGKTVEFPQNSWKTEDVYMSLQEPTTGKFQIGIQNGSIGSANNKLFIDGISIKYLSPDAVTAISGIFDKAKAAKDDAIYDLQGRRLKEIPSTKGIYIQNGRKILVK